MDGISQEANTQLINEFNSQFFFKLPTDLRYQSVDFFKFSPQSTISDHADIRFYFPPRTGPAVYFLKDIYIEAKVNLQKANGTKVEDGKEVSVVNNTTHSLIKRLNVKIGDISIVNSDNDFYFYKAYLKNLLGLSRDVKGAQIGLAADNFATDSAHSFDVMSETNVGFELRRKAFAKAETVSSVTTYKYYGDDVTYLARLQHDLVSCDVPLIPGIEVLIELSLNKNEFLVKCPSTDTEKYQLKVKELFLHVPIGILSASLYSSLEASLRNTPVLMHYTRTVVNVLEIPTNSLNFTAETIFSRTQIPSKIVIGFVDTEAFNGSYSKNGFNFRRTWTGTTSLSETNEDELRDDESDFEIINAEQRLNDLRSDLSSLGTSNQRRNSVSASIQRFLGVANSQQSNISAIENLERRIDQLEVDLANLRTLREQRRQPNAQRQTPVRAETISNFIKGTCLNFNGHPIDSLTQRSANEREDSINFNRLHYFLNFSDSLLSNSISYNDFLGGNFFCVYDLSTCSKSNVGFLVPSIRLGDLKFVVEFHKALTHKVTLIIYQEHPSLLTINDQRKVTLSYTKI